MLTINKNITAVNRTAANRTASDIQFLVFHYVGAVSTAKANTDYFKSVNRQASAHYFVDDSSIWQCVEDKDIAWHCGTSGAYKHPACRNKNSIGIEMCCKKDASGKLYISEATIQNAAELGRHIMAKYNIPLDRVLRHYDVTGKNCPAPMVENPAAWEAFKAMLADKTAEYKAVIQAHCQFSDPAGVWAVLDKHPYAADLYRKWAESYRK